MSLDQTIERPEVDFTHSIIERLARMEEKQDHTLGLLTVHASRQDQQDERIRSLETSGAKVLGMGAVIAAITGIAGARVLDVLSGVGG